MNAAQVAVESASVEAAVGALRHIAEQLDARVSIVDPAQLVREYADELEDDWLRSLTEPPSRPVEVVQTSNVL